MKRGRLNIIVIYITVIVFLCFLYNIRKNYLEPFQESRNYQVELICNVSKENKRLEKLQPLIKYFDITPSYFIDKSDVETHPLYNKFSKNITKSEVSLCINHISLLQKYLGKETYLLIFESDVKPLKDLQSIDSDLNTLVQEMKDNAIDIVFIGKGHLSHVNKSEYEKITDTLYKAPTSRCAEAYIMSPNCINAYLDYFETTDNHISIDHDYNKFFNATKEIIVSWRIPELFEQDNSEVSLIHHTYH